nr:MAG TPA: hypothetical protein [Caudoviricetes sp.]
MYKNQGKTLYIMSIDIVSQKWYNVYVMRGKK